MKMAPPVMLAQLIQALYNVVDSFFVGRYQMCIRDSAVAVQIYRALRGMKVEKKFQLKENGKKAVDKWGAVLLQ